MPTLEQYEQDKLDKMQIVTTCQAQHNLSTCSACEQLLNCDKRNTYVQAVYASMNKGDEGGFEF